ncbi:MAG TPA: hypothetical protein VFX59_03795 [Polyangiales bacterium]|nr:hypothetical protein [Polyangiales bacterium]
MSLARSLRRSSRLVRWRRASVAAVCALAVAGSAAFALGQPLYALAAGVVASIAAAWPVDLARIARALDHANQQEGRLVAAHELASARVRTPFMEAAIRDAEARPLAKGMPQPRLWWVPVLAVIELVALTLPSGPSAPARRPTLRSVPEARDERAEALATVNALEEYVAVREQARQRVVQALAPLLRGKAVTAEALRSLADAVAGPQLSSARRAQLQEALERARESERARLEEAQREAVQQERKLEQLTRPKPEQRKLEQLARPQQEEQDLQRQLDRATEALQRGNPREAADALREGAGAIARQQQETQRQREELAQQREELQRPADDAQQLQQFEQAARGGGSEPDPGEHPPAERRIGGSYQDERLRGAHGEGPSRSQVIEGASQAGFASVPYRRVYADYRAHAEQLLERDDVPPGERFYVRRYFDLVQPREPR